MLKDIKTPQDIKKLDVRQLEALAGELRGVIIETVARNGGHLSSNLGTVELTLAIDYVLDHTKDHVIFDVGHQIYAHKLLTGRYERFGTLRRKGGICGFSSMSEDPGDAFTSGHASTSISAALGLCRARDLRAGDETVVAVIGDGALTGGMSYEAMNDAGDSGTDIIVVINDNEMSISKNVGALSMHLTKIRRSRAYRTFKVNTRGLLAKIPIIGMRLFRLIERLRDMLKTLFIGANMFEAMGFKYLGPVDGHDVRKLIKALRIAREMGGPVVIHAVTRKGNGYRPAENEPDRFHGPGPFDVATGMSLTENEPGSGAVASQLLADMAADDKRICAISAAMPMGTGFVGFAEKWPERFFDVGIAEEHAVTMAGGLAAAGMRPYVAIYSVFLQRAYDQIANDVCLNSLPVTFLLDRAGLVGADGATHNGVMDLSYLRSIPGMTIAAPRDVRCLRRLVKWSVGYGKPLAIRYPKDARDLGAALDHDMPIRPGRWEKLIDGDVAIIAVGTMVQTALAAGVTLNSRGISAAVVDAMFVKPMDTQMLREIAQSAKLIVTLEENNLKGGFGEGVLSELSAMGMRADVLTLGVPDRPIRHASRAEQLAECGLDSESVAAEILERLNMAEILHS